MCSSLLLPVSYMGDSIREVRTDWLTMQLRGFLNLRLDIASFTMAVGIHFTKYIKRVITYIDARIPR